MGERVMYPTTTSPWKVIRKYSGLLLGITCIFFSPPFCCCYYVIVTGSILQIIIYKGLNHWSSGSVGWESSCFPTPALSVLHILYDEYSHTVLHILYDKYSHTVLRILYDEYSHTVLHILYDEHSHTVLPTARVRAQKLCERWGGLPLRWPSWAPRPQLSIGSLWKYKATQNSNH